MVAWAIELSQYNIEYYPRTAIKGHARVNFIVEYSFSTKPEEEKIEENTQIPDPHTWTLYVNGSSGKDKCGEG